MIRLGAALAGLAVLSISYTVEIQDGSAVGTTYTPDLYARQMREGGSPEERAAREAEQAERRSALRIARQIGAALLGAGALGFVLVAL